MESCSALGTGSLDAYGSFGLAEQYRLDQKILSYTPRSAIQERLGLELNKKARIRNRSAATWKVGYGFRAARRLSRGTSRRQIWSGRRSATLDGGGLGRRGRG